MKVTLGFSTCPNDTFIFDAAVHGKIDTEGLEFNLVLADVEELNKRAFEGMIDITKLSYHAFAYASEQYILLDSGSALGKNNGPLLIGKRKIYPDEVNNLKIAIPGKFTTAHLLFSIAYPEAFQKTEYLFSDIETAVADGEVDAGLIIHENRFTYQDKGLIKIVDLGEYWEQLTGMPIPLGGIVMLRKHGTEMHRKMSRVIRKSIEYAYTNPKSSLEFIRCHAQEMNAEVMQKHIDLYVNHFSLDLGDEGKKAVRVLYDQARKQNLIPELKEPFFINLSSI
jgi:1,4-dihydroxy-6-naphthoate synthase